MSEAAASSWRRRSAWHGIAVAGRHGSAGNMPGVCATPVDWRSLATILAGEGRRAEVESALTNLVGITPPSAPKRVQGRFGDLIWSGPDQWLLASESPNVVARAERDLRGLAAVSDQTDARAVLRVAGPRVRDALAKGCLVDLHPRVFRTGDVALTSIAHIGAQIWQIDDAPTYDIAVFRSMAASFWSWFIASASAYGCEVAAPKS